MPFSPLLPGTSPLPDPREVPPAPRSLRTGAFAAVVSLVALVALGIPFLPQLAFFLPSLQAQVEPGSGAQAGKTFQGFVYPWSRADQGGGYATPGSAANLASQASIFHMNAVIIPVIADMKERDNSPLSWNANDAGNVDTLPDSDYLQAISDARKAGLVPILELQVRQYDQQSNSVTGPQWVGLDWFNLNSKIGFSLNGNAVSPVPIEEAWFDNYTAFAVHFATLAQQQNLPYFILGDNLEDVSYDTANTTQAADPAGTPTVPGENIGKCTGRRDCEWRQVIYAIRNNAYSTITGGHQVHQGANYTGKLIYMAGWGTDGYPYHPKSKPEFEAITWWNAVDIIGIDAYFPITKDEDDPSVSDVVAGWQGTAPAAEQTGQGDIISRIAAVSASAQRPVVLTAGYESALGDNISPGNPPSTVPDQGEQQSDMQGLVQAFTGQNWWAGVFWSADEPLAPHSAQPGWDTSSNWAGDTLAKSKLAGQWLAEYYHPSPLGQ